MNPCLRILPYQPIVYLGGTPPPRCRFAGEEMLSLLKEVDQERPSERLTDSDAKRAGCTRG